MVAIMSDIEYTREDIKELATMSKPGSALHTELEDMDYDPDAFKEYMKQQPKQYRYIYQTSLDDVFMDMSNPTIQRLMTWRTSIGK